MLTELLEESRRLGFIGPGRVDTQVTHALAFERATTAPPSRALDLGAGGGLPGLPLAVLAWPETEWCFLDANQRKTEFLSFAVELLGLTGRVEVISERAEEAGRDHARRAKYDMVVARSFGLPSVVAECAAPLLVMGGSLVVSEPPSTAIEQRWPAEGLAELGLGSARSVVAPTDTGPVHLAVMSLVQASPDRYPRRVGVPSKRPLFVGSD